LKLLDGKPLTVSANSRDTDAAWGFGASQKGKGYKLHMIDSGKPMPERFEVHPMNVAESRVARRMIPTLTGVGYIVADANYDDNRLYEAAASVAHRFIAPRRRPHTGLATWPRSHPERLRAIATLEAAPLVGNTFGKHLMHLRRQIETTFGNLCSFFAGLTHLPPWVRGLPRVRLFVHAKLIINAARIRNIHA
jgi:hypothetical protein